jgi:hypothetical protein
MLQRWPGRGSTRKARRHARSDVAFAKATRLPGRSRLGRLGSTMRSTDEPSRASALGAGLSWPLRRGWVFLVATDRRSTPSGHSSGPTEGGRRDAQAARTAIEMVWQEEGLIVRCHSPSIEEDRHGREIEEASCAQPRFPGNRGKGADAQLEGKEAEEDVAREVACSGLQRSPDAAGGVARQK